VGYFGRWGEGECEGLSSSYTSHSSRQIENADECTDADAHAALIILLMLINLGPTAHSSLMQI
jgi:hypothetical protein